MSKKRYYLQESGLTVYFTVQEARCMFYALHGLSNAEIARTMDLSLRTVGFYFEIMRQKLDSSHKNLLIEKILKTDFMKYIGELLIQEREKRVNKKNLIQKFSKSRGPMEKLSSEISAQKKGAKTFTTREFQCIRQATEGKSLSDIANALNLSEATIYYYINTAREKLGKLRKTKKYSN